MGCESSPLEPKEENNVAGSTSFDTYTHTKEGTGYFKLEGENGGVHIMGQGSVLIKDLDGVYNTNEFIHIIFDDENGILLISDPESSEAEVWANGAATLLVQGTGFAEWFGDPNSDDNHWTAEYIEN